MLLCREIMLKQYHFAVRAFAVTKFIGKFALCFSLY